MNNKQRTGIFVGLLLIAIVWGAILLLSGSVVTSSIPLPTEAAFDSSAPIQPGGQGAPADPTPMAVTVPQQPVAEQVVIHFAPETDATARADYIASIGGTVVKSIDALDIVVVTIPSDVSAQTLPPSPILVSAEPNYVVTALDYVVPNDAYFPQQWGLTAIGAPDVWESVAAASTITVAVIDSGVDSTHPDLAGRILSGYDFVDDDTLAQDVSGHGTAVAGIIAANRGNEIGIAGVAPNARIMPLRVLDASGIGTYADVAAAIIFATDNGASVINLSLGGQYPSTMLENAVNYAASRGVLVIAAAGNNGQDGALYPAAFAGAIGVGSVDQTLQRSVFSNYGTTVSVYAPGSAIITTGANGGYVTATGTSYAAPHVAGIAALELGRGGTLTVDGGMVHIAAPIGDATPTAAPDSPDDGDQTVTAQAINCTITQVTTTTGATNAWGGINGSGTHIVFHSTADLTGSNAEGYNDLFVWDAVNDFVQITDSSQSHNFTLITISNDGWRVAFSSPEDLTGSNPDGNRELYLWDRALGISQLSFTNPTNPWQVSEFVSISGDGTRAAFVATALGDPDTTYLYLWDETTGISGLATLTGATLGPYPPTISDDGTKIVFHYTGDLTGGNADGNYEIFLWEDGVGFTQITSSTTGNSIYPSMNADATVLAFFSSADLVSGSNTDGNTELFRWEQSAGFTQITDTTYAGEDPDLFTSMDYSGNRIAFNSLYDLTGNNADGSTELFLWDSVDGITQVTSDTDVIYGEMDGAGHQIVFSSEDDLVGNNPDGNREVYGLTCTDEAPTIVDQPRSPTIISGGQATLFVAAESEFGLTYQWYEGTVGDTSTPVGSERLLTTAPLTSSTQYWVRISNGVGSVDSIAALVTVIEPSGEVCETTQITNSTGNTYQAEPVINYDGTRIFFESSANLTGENPANNIVLYRWDASTGFVLVANTNEYIEMSDVSAVFDRIVFESGSNVVLWDESSGITVISNGERPSLNESGDRIIFVSTANLTGSNADGSQEIFVWDEGSGITQLTNISAGFEIEEVRVSRDGTRVAFITEADITGGNPTNLRTLFVQVIGGTTYQAALGLSDHNLWRFVGFGGHRLFFNAVDDFAGNNADGNAEIFMWDESTGLTQLTDTVYDEIWFNTPALTSINDDGTRITYRTGFGYSDVEDWETWQWREGVGIVPITDSNVPNDVSWGFGASDDGSRILIISNANLTGFNPDNDYAINVIWDETSGFMQIGDPVIGPDLQWVEYMSGDGRHMLFRSQGDHTGQNPDGDWELFMITCTEAAPPTITLQPANQTITSGQTATLTVTATGATPLSYQWYEGEVGVTTTPVGTDSPVFTTPALSATGHYWVRVSNSQGSVDSVPVTIWMQSEIAPVCAFQQITNTTGADNGSSAVISRSGAWVDLVSPHDLTGTGTPGNINLYRWNDGYPITLANFSSPATAVTVQSISEEGYITFFDAAGDIAHNNPDGGMEAFVWQHVGFGVNQESGSLNGDNYGIVGNADGSRFAYIQAEPVGGGVTEYRLYLHIDYPTAELVTHTSSTYSGEAHHDISADGTRLVFAFPDDYTGGNADLSLEVFLWEEGVGITQITNTSAAQFAHPLGIDDSGTRIIFLSDADFVGLNADGNTELFLWEDGVGFTQITQTTGSYALDAEITGDGQSIVIASDYNFTGINADGNVEIFNWTQATGIVQLTNTTGAAVTDIPVSVTGDGTSVVLASTRDFVGGNADGNREVYGFTCTDETPVIVDQPRSPTIISGGQATLFVGADSEFGLTYQWYEGIVGDTSTPVGNQHTLITAPLTSTTQYWVRISNGVGSVDSIAAVVTVVEPSGEVCETTQITNTNGIDTVDYFTFIERRINHDGSRFIFESRGDLTGENPSNDDALYLWDASSGYILITTDRETDQVAANATLNRVVFLSRGNFTGQNGDASVELFLWDETSGYTQITHNTVASKIAIDELGDRVAFLSTGNPTGGNPDGSYEIFAWDLGTGVISQVTNIPVADGSHHLQGFRLSNDGIRIVYTSPADLTGDNPDGLISIYVQEIGQPPQFVASMLDPDVNDAEYAGIYNIVGGRFVFALTGDPVGNNADGNIELFLWDETTGITQITDTARHSAGIAFNHPLLATLSDDGTRITYRTGFGFYYEDMEVWQWREGVGIVPITDTNVPYDISLSVGVDADGSRILIQTNANLTGFNPDNNYGFNVIWDENYGFMQLTDPELSLGFLWVEFLSGDGRHLLFNSQGDYTGENPDGDWEWFMITCTLPGAPTINIQPADQLIDSGETATFTVTATGDAPLSYQWYEGAVGDTSNPVGTDSPSFTTPTLTRTRQYWVRVTNASGSVDSQRALAMIDMAYADLQVVPILQPETLLPLGGESTTIWAMLSNFGTTIARNVVLDHTLGAEFTITDIDATLGNYDTVTGLWTLDYAPPIFSPIITRVTVQAAPFSDDTYVTNTLEIVSSDTPDPSTAYHTFAHPLPMNGTSLSLDISDGAGTLVLREGQTSTINVYSAMTGMASGATNIQIQVTLPAELTFISANPSLGSYDSGTGIWTIDRQPPWLSSATLALQVQPNNGTSGQIATVTAEYIAIDQPLEFPEGNPAQTDFAIDGVHITSGVMVDNETPQVGDTITFNISATNWATVNATNVQIQVDLFPGLLYLSDNPEVGTYDPDTNIWSIPTIAASDSVTMTIIAEVTPQLAGLSVPYNDHSDRFIGADQLNGQTHRPYDDFGSTPIALHIRGDIHLLIDKSVSNATRAPGQPLTYTMTLTNDGPQDGTNIVAYLPVVDEVTYDSHTASHGTYDPITGYWTIPSLLDTETATLQVNVTVISGQPYNHNNIYFLGGMVFDADQSFSIEETGNFDVFVDSGQPDLWTRIYADILHPEPGDEVNFAMVFGNYGSVAGTSVVIQALLPEGLTYVSHSTNFGTYDPGTGIYTLTDPVSFSEAGYIFITATVDNDMAGQVLTYNTTISGNETDYSLANNTGSVNIVVQGVSIADQPNSETINSGETATFTVTPAGYPTTFSYQWYQGESGDTSTPVGTNSPSFTTPTLTESTRYWVRVSNSQGSVDSEAAVASVLLTQPPQCTFTQLTDTTDDIIWYPPDINANGTRVVFVSADDLVGNNADGNQELFIWDDTLGYIQITDTVGDDNYWPTISDDGSRIAFYSQADLTGENPTHTSRIFLWEDGVGFTQITTTIQAFGFPAISGDGSRIAFYANDADISLELFLWDEVAGLTQLTNTPRLDEDHFYITVLPPAINADGTRVAFEFNQNLVGTNSDLNVEIFLWEDGEGFSQITNTLQTPSESLQNNQIPMMDGTGNRVVFISNRDLVSTNSDENDEFFLWEEGTGFTQLTNTTLISPAAMGAAVLNGDGSHIALMSGYDLADGNADSSSEVFIWQEGSGFIQITNTLIATIGDLPAINNDGTSIAFNFAGNLTGQNPDENVEIFLAECEDVPVPPVILDEPDSVTINSGQSTTLNVVATGDTPLSYQWYQGATGNTSTPVGTDSASFTTPALTQTTQYWVRVSNAAGSADSVTATVSVNQAPLITQQPASQSILSGQTATLNVLATGTAPLSYQWYQGATGDTSMPVGTDSSSFTTPALTATTDYWVRVSNVAGSADSVTATITVQTPPTITDQPDDTTINSWWTATLNVTATGDAPLSYQWYQGASGDTSTPVGTDSSSFTTPALTETTPYWVRVSNAVGFDDSDTATITVVDSPPLAVTDLSINGVTQTQISLLWSQNDPTVAFYQVQHSTDGTNWSLLASVNVPTTFFTHTQLNCNTTHHYRVIAQRTHDGQSSAPSNAVNATTNACAGLNAPTNLVAAAQGRDRITLTWANPNPPGEVSNFYLEVSPDGTNWAGLMTFNGSALSYNHTGLTCATTYHYRLRAFRMADGQFTAYTATANATTSPCPVPVENTIGLYREGVWQFRDANSSGDADVVFTFGPRQPGWIALVGDWNGDGVDGIGLYQNGVWLLRDVAGTGVQDYVFVYGPRESGWIPVVGDWNGDDIDTVGVYQNGTWLLRNSNTAGTFDIAVSFPPGGSGWRPITGDWDGNGLDSIGYYANGMWYLHNSLTHTNSAPGFAFGPTTGGWLPIYADWNADGVDTIGVYADGVWRMRNTNAAGAPELGFTFGRGLTGWQPIAGYRDDVGGTGLGILSVAPPIDVPGESTPVPPPTATTPAPVDTATPMPTDTPTDVPESTPDVTPPTDTPAATIPPDPPATPLPESTAEPSP